MHEPHAVGRLSTARFENAPSHRSSRRYHDPLYFVVFGAAIGSGICEIEGISYGRSSSRPGDASP